MGDGKIQNYPSKMCGMWDRLQQLFLFGLVGFTDITLAHATERGVGVNSGVVPITPFDAEGITSNRFNIL